MRKTYFLLAAAVALGSLTAQAIERPKTPAGMPKDGGQYVLVNAYTPMGTMTRTSWDGALYFESANFSAFSLTAQKNDDGTWSFYRVAGKAQDGETDSLNYMAMPDGSGNLNIKSPVQAKWTIEAGSVSGYYTLVAGEGNSTPSQGLKLHLNAGGQYFVISEEVNGGSWYPDYAGGVIEAENDYGYEVDENGRALFADHTSEQWAFLAPGDSLEYYTLYGCYNSIVNYESAYCAIEGYADGFNATLAAVTAVYEKSDFNWEEDPLTISAMINQKVALYQALETAKAIESPDAALSNAIENADAAFLSQTSESELTASSKALNEAVLAFQQGSGDMTGLGTNMSFEDLSAQDGATTSGVAAPPAGWTVTIGGDVVTTADEVKSHGIANWHGVNADCSGEGKDGEYGFGIWTSGVPTYEISQTVEGLESGTYVVSAGVMVGANTSGSRRTTQRLFGNYNVSYFASEMEYDASLLDKLEVPSYSNLVEPTTDTELQKMEMRAYVNDGKLTFGLRTDGNYQAALRESSNSAGGDGWFKLDNFHLQYLGYVGEDAAAVANHFIEICQSMQNEQMETSVSAKLAEALAASGNVTADTPKADIDQAIASFSALIAEVETSVSAYQKLMEAVEKAYNEAETYQYYSGFEEYMFVVEEGSEAYEEGTLTPAQIDEYLARLDAQLNELLKSGIAVNEYLNIIQNPSFEDLSAQSNANNDGAVNPPAGWTLTLNGVKCETSADYATAGATMGWCAINSGDAIDETDENGVNWTAQYTDGTHLWGIWAANVPDVELSQSFTGIPNGTYTLSCDLVVQYNWGGHCVTTQRIFANDFIQMYGAEATYAAQLNDTEDMSIARLLDEKNPNADLKHMNYAGWLNESSYGSTSCPHAMSLTFGVSDGNLTLGFRTNNVDPFTGQAHSYDSAGWFKIDNFKLFYASEDVPTGMTQTTATDGQQVQLLGQQYYTVGGSRVSGLQKGVTIVKNIMSDGSVRVTKVLR